MHVSGILIKKVETCVEKLLACGKKVTFAESCTGGLLAFLFSSVPDASKVFFGSVVTYMDDAKIKLLNIPAEIIETHGAASEKVADEMAFRALEAMRPLGIDIAVSITGFAGSNTSNMRNEGDGTTTTNEERTGDVYIGLATRSGTRTVYPHKFNPHSKRYEIQARAAEEAIDIILAEIGR
ncbi:CinA family protein [Anaplasma bovis]|uniref:CinA family protein n=1 Tax=Anaplasma bovis TaxID=186733 RepID=UPI002FF15AAA